MSDVLRVNGNSKRLKIKVDHPGIIFDKSDENPEENYIQTNLQNYYDRGFSEGKEYAEKKLKKVYDDKISAEVAKLESVIKKINDHAASYEKIFESVVIQLSFLVAEKIIHYELSNKKIIEDTLQKALGKVVGSNNIIVKLNPEDLKVINDKSNKFMQQRNLSHVKFEAEKNIEQGGCYIETEIGNVDARISSQLEELEKLFKESL